MSGSTSNGSTSKPTVDARQERDLKRALATLWVRFPGSLEDAYIVQCRHFCKVIRKQEQPRITAEDATRTLVATLAVFEAFESGKQISLKNHARESTKTETGFAQRCTG